ncbi:MAG TPA: hypothetical protein EYP90_11180 [Chromatiaceae bacterium]|nr:hypothetical protein [Chromatiaceae bacterium]
MSIEIDVSGSISENLANFIQSEMQRETSVQPPTLGSVLASMEGGSLDRLIEKGRIDRHDKDDIFVELRNLIEEYGDDALAQRFIRYRAGSNLAMVIEALLDSSDAESPPTLGTVRDSINQGLVTQIIARGDIDPDEDETLLAELERLISIHGEEALAEEYVL